MSALLVIIYISFISLGLPDAILGSAWPELHLDLGISVGYAGIISMIVSAGTVVSSLMSERFIIKFGTGKVTVLSVLFTACALAGFTVSSNFILMCFFAIPLGLGAGSVDTALNNFVAIHYKSRHMNWLHAFWGIGATAGPLLMSLFILQNNGWRVGYGIIALFQIILVIVLFLTLPLWNRTKNSSDTLNSTEETSFEVNNDIQDKKNRIGQLLALPGAKPALVAFFCYCTVELIAGMWGATYLVNVKKITAEVAARWVGLYYLGITVGRILSGFLAIKMNNNQLIRFGQIVSIVGVIFLFIPGAVLFQLVGFILLGLGNAPVFPAMLHETPVRFGKGLSQGVMGIQMATAYIGNTLMPPLFGLVASKTSFIIMPIVLLGFLIIEYVSTVLVNSQIRRTRG
ncbi:MAG: MFS transporter [Treponema sp. CETP13]|nr:MAG: MFS transporter [Treponema sp. CETP13]